MNGFLSELKYMQEEVEAGIRTWQDHIDEDFAELDNRLYPLTKDCREVLQVGAGGTYIVDFRNKRIEHIVAYRTEVFRGEYVQTPVTIDIENQRVMLELLYEFIKIAKEQEEEE